MYQKRKSLENTLILILDLLCMMISISAAFAIRFQLFWGSWEHGDQIWQVSILALLFVVINVFVEFNRHFFRRGFFEELVAAIKMNAVFAIGWVFMLFVTHRTDQLSRLVFGIFVVINVPLTYAVRLLSNGYGPSSLV